MAIQMRRGNAANYDESKMLPGEFGVAVDEEELYIAFSTGNSKRVLTEDDAETINSTLESKAPKGSPAFTGSPTAPTATPGTNTTQLATTAFVHAEVASATKTLTVTDRGSGTVELGLV